MQLLDDLAAIVGAPYLHTGEDMARWATPWTRGWQPEPLCVVRPAETAGVSAILRCAHAAGVPVIPVSGHTGLTGGTSGQGMILLSLDRMSRIEAIDPAARTVTCQAGVILSSLHDAVAERDLIFPLTFGARGSARIGGVLATNAGGSNVLRYGNTRDLCLGLEAVLADGRVMNLMSGLHKDNSGLNLRHLLIGSEGTLGIITRAVLKLHPAPRVRVTAMAAPRSLPDALDLLHTVQGATGGAVEAFEYMPQAYMNGYLALHPEARAPFDAPHDVNVLIELSSTAPRDAAPGPDGPPVLQSLLEDTLADMLDRGLIADAHVARSDAERAEMWARREAAAEIAYARSPVVDTDIAVALPDVATFLERAGGALQRLDPGATDLAVSHLGDGNIHYSVYPTRDDPALKEQIREMVEEIVQDLSGSFSAEHGIGIAKLGSMARRKDPVALEAMRAIKAALDPDGILTPGKVYPT